MENTVKKGVNSFTFIGKAVIGSDSLEDAVKSKSGWIYPRTSFGVDTTGEESSNQRNVVYPRVQNGGYYEGKPLKFFVRNGDKSEELLIPFEERFNEEQIKKVPNYRKFTVDLGKGRQEFITSVDFLKYLQENLTDGEEIIVSGNVEYSTSDPSNPEKPTYRNFIATRVYKNNEKTVKDSDGNETKQITPPSAKMTQETFFTSDSLDSDWKGEIEREGETIVSVFVPEYIGTVQDPNNNKNYLDYKKTVPIGQSLVVKSDANMKLVEFLMDVKDDEVVRTVQVVSKVIDGYDVSSGTNADYSPELQEMIDLGIMTEEEVQASLTVRGPRKSEVVFDGISIYSSADGGAKPFYDDKYGYEALVVPPIKSDIVKDSDDSSTDLDLDVFDASDDSDDILNMFA